MSRVGRFVPDSPAELGPPLDAALAALAAHQHGVVTRRQLRALGLRDTAITERVARGRLHRVHRGVYAVGHPVLGARGQWMAAVLAGGPGTVLSHAAAGALWDLRASAAARIDITVRRSGRAKRPSLRVHRPRDLRPDETTVHQRIPVTTPARTILDLAATLQPRPLERLVDQAENTRLTHVAALDALARAHPGHRGASRLLAALDSHAPGTTLTRSDLEERFLALCREHGLPRPRVNHHLQGKERDFVFPAHRIVIETDSWTHHRTRRAFEEDRARDQLLIAAGWRTIRLTHRQLTNDPHGVAATLAAALGSG
jgi:very-short-patch-repair endonuclease